MLSIIVPWCNRDELGQTIASMLACAADLGGEVVVVNFGGDSRRLVAGLPDVASLRVFDAGPQPYFNKAKANNLGAQRALHGILFFCDCDIVLDTHPVKSLALRVAREPGIFGTLAGVRETVSNARGAGNVICFGYELFIRIASGRELRIVDNEEDAEKGTRQAPGLLFVRRADFLSVHGYNGRLHGWGWEDQDMVARLTLGVGLRRISEGHVLHLSHSDEARVAHYPVADRWESRDRAFRQALANYDRDDFTGTYASDIADMLAAEVAR